VSDFPPTCPAPTAGREAINGILDEAKDIMTEFKGSPALDAGLLSAAQAVERYGISRYGTLKAWANELGLADAINLLDAARRRPARNSLKAR
jgi:ferritin-like metal-binding protein YciE